jgi:hypothetical protein
LATEAAISSLVTGKNTRQIEDESTTKRRDCQRVRAELRQWIEQAACLDQQIRELAADRSLVRKRFELSQAEAELRAIVQQWRVLTITMRFLEYVKEAYERQKQPETLREASEYLSELTAGRYLRVWTRLGQNVLLVDDAKGHSLPIEVLSHGTREQLFLSLRLALVGLFARRGARLPLVLDDVLVNFDAPRAKAAIRVLHDFSKRGHQILMLTCHEHIASLCKAEGIDVRRLPDHRGGTFDEAVEMHLGRQPKKHRARRQKDTSPGPAPITDASLVATPTAAIAVFATSSKSTLATASAPSEHPETSTIRSPSISHFRIDLPDRSPRPPAIMRRWWTEDFIGQRDDRVTPLWLLSGDETTSSSKNITGSTLDAPNASLDLAVASLHEHRVFGDSSPIITEPALGDEDWDL